MPDRVPAQPDESESRARADLARRMKSGESYIAMGFDSHDQQQMMQQALCELRNDNALLRQALGEAAIPLEVMHALGHDWRHPKCRWWWRRLVSDDLRRQIRQGVEALRSVL